MKMTVRKLSELTGYSPATVSNALNGKVGVNRKTAGTILKKAKEMGYYTGFPSKKIYFATYQTNGLITDDTPFFSMLLDGFQTECKSRGYETVIIYLDKRSRDFHEKLEELLGDEEALVALVGAELMDEDIELFRCGRCRLLFLDYWNEKLPYDGILINNVDSAKKAVHYLLEKGHRALGYLKGNFRIKAFRLREIGYWEALEEKGLTGEEKYTVTLSTTMEGAYKDMQEYLKMNPKLPTAYFADNDMIALGAMKALQEHGVRIPEDVSIVGFDDLPFCEISSPRLTSMRVPKQEMGKMGAWWLLDIMDKVDMKSHLSVSTEFIERDSVKTLF